MDSLDKQYTNLLQDILDNGTVKKDRTGTGTISVFGRTIRHKMSDGFPLITTKKMYFKGIVTELLWFLKGDTNIRYLIENNCHIWDGDAYQAYVKKRKHSIRSEGDRSELAIQSLEETLIYTKEEFIERIKTDVEFAKKWGDLGPIYGHQWRRWHGRFIPMGDASYFPFWDQIANLINDLKNNPDSRRLMVNAWNVSEISEMTLPPCHYGFQCYTRELTWAEQVEWVFKNTDVEMENLYIVEEIAKPTTPKRAISLIWNQRSVDTPLGLPFNIASYGLLLEILAKIVNMVPDELIGNLGDTHIYLNQVDGVKEQIGRDYTYDERFNILAERNGPLGLNHDRIEEEILSSTPARTREPFPLPKLVMGKTDAFWKVFDVRLFGHLDPHDFSIANYQSHSKIDYPLSN